MLFTFINGIIVLVILGTLLYVFAGDIGKQLSSLLLSLAAGGFVAWCTVVGLYHVVLGLTYLPQAVTALLS